MQPYDKQNDIRVEMFTKDGYVPGVIRGRTYSNPVRYVVKTDARVYDGVTSDYLRMPQAELERGIRLVKGGAA